MSSRGPVTRGANGWLPLTVAFCTAASPTFPLVPHHSLFYPSSPPPSWTICICQCAYQLSLLIQFRKMSSQIGLQRILADGSTRKWREWSRRRSSECAHSQRNCTAAGGRGVAGPQRRVHACLPTRAGFGKPRTHCGVWLALQDLSIKSWISGVGGGGIKE